MLIEQRFNIKANSLLAVCLFVGIAGGWLLRGSRNAAVAGSAATANITASTKMDASKASQPSSPVRVKEMADTQAGPLVDKLKSDPNNPELLTNIGNLYYDTQQYSVAIDYYGRALRNKPADAAIRTDMATAYWYTGDADRAIAEFNNALTYEPNKSNTLFNLGLVKLKGKKDKAGALADWEKLLATNPNYEGKDNVERMIAEAK
jgi:cytochrome c-type biogenesis protein CcmH/NrfG